MKGKSMIHLKPMTEKDCHYLVDWNIDKDENYLFQWAGYKAYHYPISFEQINKRLNEQAQIYLIVHDKTPIGSVELDKINEEMHSANVCRFILCNDVKSKGLGTQALKQLINLAFNEMMMERLTLGVFCYNIGAIRCYEKCGFLVKEYHQSEDPNWNVYIMELIHHRTK